MSVIGHDVLAHRASFEAFVGAIPPWQRVLHCCDQPSCVNPDHLFLGTQLDNIADMCAKGRRCPVLPARRALSDADIVRIRAEASLFTIQTQAEQFGVSPSTIRKARHSMKLLSDFRRLPDGVWRAG